MMRDVFGLFLKSHNYPQLIRGFYSFVKYFFSILNLTFFNIDKIETLKVFRIYSSRLINQKNYLCLKQLRHLNLCLSNNNSSNLFRWSLLTVFVYLWLICAICRACFCRVLWELRRL